MKRGYFFRPIWRLFDFKGVTGRAEYFTYAVTSFLVTVFLTLAAHIFFILNWPNLLPPEMLDENGRPLWFPSFGFQEVFYVLWSAFQFPMLALTVRSSFRTGVFFFVWAGSPWWGQWSVPG
jgi:uncharacterized membrane protein YhaH (DUF805 family)